MRHQPHLDSVVKYADLDPSLVGLGLDRSCYPTQLKDIPVPLGGISLEHNDLDGGRTCAIIGKSGILRGSKLGSFIDAHDEVWRPNAPPVRGFEEDVGSKTTVVTINFMIWRHRCMEDYSNCQHYIVEHLGRNRDGSLPLLVWNGPKTVDFPMYKPSLERWIADTDTPPMYFGRFEEEQKATYTRFMKDYGLSWSRSNGEYAMFSALLHCRVVNLFGFYPFTTLKNGTAIPAYYYDNADWYMAQYDRKEGSILGVHHFDTEMWPLFRNLSSSGIIALYPPSDGEFGY